MYFILNLIKINQIPSQAPDINWQDLRYDFISQSVQGLL